MSASIHIYFVEFFNALEVNLLVLHLQFELVEAACIEFHELLSFAYIVANLYKDSVDAQWGAGNDVVLS